MNASCRKASTLPSCNVPTLCHGDAVEHRGKKCNLRTEGSHLRWSIKEVSNASWRCGTTDHLSRLGPVLTHRRPPLQCLVYWRFNELGRPSTLFNIIPEHVGLRGLGTPTASRGRCPK